MQKIQESAAAVEGFESFYPTMQKAKWSCAHTHSGAFARPWILPRTKKCPPDTFCTRVRTGAALSTPISSSANNKSYPFGWLLLLAEDEGFEPPQTESESGVLPLHKSSIAGTFVIILTFSEKSRSFLKKFKISDEGILPAKKATYSSQGKGFPGKTWCFKYRKVFSSPSSRSMVSKKSNSCLVWGCIQLRSALRIKYS